MSKFSVEAFKSVVSSAVAAEDADAQAREQAQLTEITNKIQCSSGGSSIVLHIARIASLFDGFPNSVDLASSNGYNSGLSLRRRHGVWTVFCGNNLSNAYQLAMGSVSGNLSSAVAHALKAMKIKHSSAAYQTLLNHVAWSTDADKFHEEIVSVAPALPKSVLDALLCHGTERFDLNTELYRVMSPWEFQRIWLKALLAAGAEVNARPSAKHASSVYVAADKGDENYLGLLLTHGGDVESRAPNGNTAIASAVAGGHASCYRLLRLNGADHHFQSKTGDNLLHEAAEGICRTYDGHPLDNFAGIIRNLIKSGINPYAVNKYNQTPADVVRKDYPHRNEYDRLPEEVEGILALLEP